MIYMKPHAVTKMIKINTQYGTSKTRLEGNMFIGETLEYPDKSAQIFPKLLICPLFYNEKVL